jgi:hypothetical protein
MVDWHRVGAFSVSGGVMSTLYRARVVRSDAEGVYVEIPELGEGNEWGPLETPPVPLVIGDPVIVGSINEILEDLALVAKLVTVAVPGNQLQAYYFDSALERFGSGITPTNGMITWLNAEQRLEIYSDEGIPGWLSYYGAKFNQILMPADLKTGVGYNTPAATYDVALANSTDALLKARVTGDANARYTVDGAGKISWGPGSSAADTTLERVAAGQLQVGSRLGIAGTPAATASVTSRQSTDRTGYYSVNSEASVTHVNAHFHALESGTNASRLLESWKASEGNPRLQVDVDGEMRWGPGSTAPDTRLYRSGVGILRTDADLVVGDDLTVDGDAVVTGGLAVTGTFGRPGILMAFGSPTINNNTVTVLTPVMTTPAYNNYGMWTSGTNITIPRTAWWEVGAVFRFASQVTTVGIRQLRITLNGADEMIFPCVTTTQQNGTNTIASGVHMIPATAGDVITIGTFQNSGANLGLVATSRAWVRLVEG